MEELQIVLLLLVIFKAARNVLPEWKWYEIEMSRVVMDIKDWKEDWLSVPVEDFGITQEGWVKKVEQAADQVKTELQFHMEEYVWQQKSGSLRAEDAAFDAQDIRLQVELQQGMPSE